MSRRRPDTSDATTVRTAPGRDDELPAGLLPRLDDDPGPARRLPSAKTAAMVTSIVDAALQEPAPAERSQPQPRVAPRRLAPILAAALVAAAVVGAAAAVVTTRYLAPAPARQELPPRAPVVPAPAPLAPPAVAPPPEAPPLVQPAVEDPPTARPRNLRRPPAKERVLPADAPAEDVLALANQRRKERAWREADALYRRVVKTYPKSDAAIVAEIASATLHLEHLGDAAGALAGYRRVLRARPGGALGEEARWGIAEAFRARGDAAGEEAALRVFVETHPGSAMAPAARRRLTELARP